MSLLEQIRPCIEDHINVLSQKSLRELWSQTETGYSEEDPDSLVTDWIRMQFKEEVIDELVKLCSASKK
jgi:predicted KAP-like P-loop ATPase